MALACYQLGLADVFWLVMGYMDCMGCISPVGALFYFYLSDSFDQKSIAVRYLPKCREMWLFLGKPAMDRTMTEIG